MKNIRKIWQVLIELVLIAAFALALIGIFKVFSPSGSSVSESQIRAQPTQTQVPEESVTPGPVYPPPQNTALNKGPLSTVEAGQAATATAGTTPWVTKTPYLSYTPYPTPAERSETKNTPLPLKALAKDAAGRILYIKSSENGKKISLSFLDVDSKVQIKNEGSLVPDIFPTGELFPSPNGMRLAVVGAWGAGSVYDISNGKLEPFSAFIQPKLFFNWYPDNRRVLILGDSGYLYIVDPLSGDYTSLGTPEIGFIDGAVSSPDGLKVVYSYRKDDFSNKEVWIVNADGTDAQLLFSSPGSITNFSWSPDGKYIAFFGSGWNLMNADGTNIRKLDVSPLSQCYFIPPIWSPDSRYIAFTSSQNPSIFCQGWNDNILSDTNIELYDNNSGTSRSITPDRNKGNLFPAWSPDGSQISFVSNRSGAPEIWVMNSDGENLRQLTHNNQSITFISWYKP